MISSNRLSVNKALDLEINKMKIYYIQNCRLPTEKAHGYQIMKMCEAFASKDVDLELIVPKKSNPITENAFEYYNVKNNFKIRYLKFFDFFKIRLFPQKISYILNELEYLVIILFLNNDSTGICITRNEFLAAILKLKKFMVVYECHDWFRKWKKISLFCLKKVDILITTNIFIKENFLNNNFHPKSIHCLPNGIDLEIFGLDISKTEARYEINRNPDLKCNIIHNKKILLYTGSYKTMGVEKGIDEILLALTKMKNSDVHFLAVGGNEKDRSFYLQMAKKLGVDNKIQLLGRVVQEQLAIIQKSADILLMPFPDKAHYKYHMTPLKMFEYMASKRPIIASSLPSIKAILNEKNAFFVEPGNANSLAQMIKYLLAHEAKSEQNALRAYSDVSSFTWINRASKIINYINYEQ